MLLRVGTRTSTICLRAKGAVARRVELEIGTGKEELDGEETRGGGEEESTRADFGLRGGGGVDGRGARDDRMSGVPSVTEDAVCEVGGVCS